MNSNRKISNVEVLGDERLVKSARRPRNCRSRNIVAIYCDVVSTKRYDNVDILVRVSIVNQSRKVLLDTYVKPEKKLVDKRIRINRIIRTASKYGEDFVNVQNEVVNILQGKILVGHNIKRSLSVLHITHPQKNIRDTLDYEPLRQLLSNGNTTALIHIFKVILGSTILKRLYNSVMYAKSIMDVYNRLIPNWETYMLELQKNNTQIESAEEKTQIISIGISSLDPIYQTDENKADELLVEHAIDNQKKEVDEDSPEIEDNEYMFTYNLEWLFAESIVDTPKKVNNGYVTTDVDEDSPEKMESEYMFLNDLKRLFAEPIVVPQQEEADDGHTKAYIKGDSPEKDEKWLCPEHLVDHQKKGRNEHATTDINKADSEWHKNSSKLQYDDKKNKNSESVQEKTSSADRSSGHGLRYQYDRRPRYRRSIATTNRKYNNGIPTEQFVDPSKKETNGYDRTNNGIAVAKTYNVGPKKNDRYEIPCSEIHLIEKLGHGNFSEVYYGKWRNIDVAVKVLDEENTSRYAFWREADIIKKFRHNRLIALYAMSSQIGPIYIVQEYMPKGNLLNFLSKGAGRYLYFEDLIDIAIQIASGMEYLEYKQLVHGNLAARNVLMGENNIVKICDFGLARAITDNNYCPKKDPRFPVKWTALEAIMFNLYSIKSDIWSYGVVLMEIFTYGQEPYPDMDNGQVIDFIERGLRIPMPTNHFMPVQLYHLLLQCWDITLDKRPTFKFLNHFFETLS
ncbi:uncharacterized protein LOC119668079 [Teleopsis dalmanni]|uniref:uncharacterized protein LOC119668079 n=1 Tax=Teleopsis dalmanni TaxID=139649 RepID=UPI0018CFA867|nr:uncharacterized protein LOC119668079 [Teleopsis dalmanni]